MNKFFVCFVVALLAVVLCEGTVPCNQVHPAQYVCEDDNDDMVGMRTCLNSKFLTRAESAKEATKARLINSLFTIK